MEQHQVKQDFRKEREYRIESQAGRKSSSSRLSYYLDSSLHRRKEPQRHAGFFSFFFFKDNPQHIYLKMSCSRKKKNAFRSFIFNSSLYSTYNPDSHQIIDPFTSALSAETWTLHFSFGNICYSGTHKLGFWLVAPSQRLLSRSVVLLLI